MNAKKDFLIVDFEFTQYLKPVGKPRAFFSEIIEIGCVKIDGDTLETVGQLQNFVKPHFFPNHVADSLAFCMITEADMKTAIDFNTMLERLESLYSPGETYFVSWGNEDYRVLKQGCERHAVPKIFSHEDYLDLAAVYKQLKGAERTIGLKAAAEELEVDTGGLWHTAYDDANNTSKILLKLLADGWMPGAVI